MIDCTQGQFEECIKNQNTKAYCKPLEKEIRQYTRNCLLSDDAIEDAYGRFFALVEKETGNHWNLGDSYSRESPSLYSERVERIGKGRADVEKTINVYFWFHQSE